MMTPEYCEVVVPEVTINMPVRADPVSERWVCKPYIRHDMIAATCDALERSGYGIVAVLDAGTSAQGAVASVLARLKEPL